MERLEAAYDELLNQNGALDNNNDEEHNPGKGNGNIGVPLLDLNIIFSLTGLMVLDSNLDEKLLLLVVGEHEEVVVEGAEVNKVMGKLDDLPHKITRYNEFIPCNLFSYFFHL